MSYNASCYIMSHSHVSSVRYCLCNILPDEGVLSNIYSNTAQLQAPFDKRAQTGLREGNYTQEMYTQTRYIMSFTQLLHDKEPKHSDPTWVIDYASKG